MKKNGLKIFFLVTLILLCTLVFIIGTYDKKELSRNHLLTTGVITNCSVGSKGSSGTLFIDFSFFVDDTKYNRSTSFKLKEIAFKDCNNFFFNKNLPVVFNPENPSVCLLLITPKDFSRFGYQFPDSLKWVLQYVRE
jgi:hypothetical protein